jgi:predicted naringenin-chalcone synthase
MRDSFEELLDLKPSKLVASRRVLAEYGNISRPSLIFVLEDDRRSKIGREIVMK